jgi:peptidoglycan/xylan/chitin deacetylase (PgdA/CDA1 family)
MFSPLKIKRKKIAAVSGVILIILFLVIGFIRQQYVLPILMYHSVRPFVALENRLVVSVNTFERQMNFLKKHNYNVLSLEDAAALIKDRKKLPPKSIVLTFDDGYKDNYTYAFPILEKYNFAATIFLIVSELDRPDRLSWKEINQMQDSGLISFGSHTINHVFLEYINSDEELKREIAGSKRMLEEKLKKPLNSFSYPMGRFNAKVRQFVIDAGYKVAVVTNPGKGYPNNDVFILKRLRISENANNLFIFWIKTSGYYNFIREQRHK